MPESFGARLRRQRERQHVELGAIAERTKIKQSLLEGLERDDVSHWPGGIFRRAYIRAYAHAIGLEPEEVVREFVERYPDPSDVSAEVLSAAMTPADRDGSSRPPMRLRYVVESAMGALARRPAPAGEKPAMPSALPVAMAADAPSPARAPVPGDRMAENAGPGLDAVAALCTAFARVATADEVTPLLGSAARLLGARGLIVWLWDADGARLRPVLAHGYPDRVLAQVPALERGADNATAEAFRSGRPSVVEPREPAGGALVVPLLNAAGCSGVLAIELSPGERTSGDVAPLAAIVAAQLARLIESDAPAESAGRRPA